MDFRPITGTERQALLTALRGNAEDGNALLMDRNTSFAGMADDVSEDERVVNAIKSVPCHY